MDTDFDGTADLSLDAKNRLTVPARHRARFAEGAVIAMHTEGCLAIWRPEGHAEFLERAMEGINPFSTRGRDLARRLNGFKMAIDLDGAGRLALRQDYLDHAGLEKDVTVVGAGTHLEVWNREAWVRQCMGPDDKPKDLGDLLDHLN